MTTSLYSQIAPASNGKKVVGRNGVVLGMRDRSVVLLLLLAGGSGGKSLKTKGWELAAGLLEKRVFGG